MRSPLSPPCFHSELFKVEILANFIYRVFLGAFHATDVPSTPWRRRSRLLPQTLSPKGMSFGQTKNTQKNIWFVQTRISPLCPTSHKEVGQFYSPSASDIASQLYSAFAEWYSLREFYGE